MKNALKNAIPITGMDLSKIRTPNAALADRLYRGSITPAPEDGPWQHGRITTANAELFGSAFMSEPMTNYAVGWSDPAGYDALVEFIAPSFQAPGELFQFLEFDNSEEFLSDGSYDDLRAINADFKTVGYTQNLATGRVANRGLRIELDWDYIKPDLNWQQRYTGKLLSRLKRNQSRRAAALLIASAVSNPLVWNGTGTQPDVSLEQQIITSGDTSGISPNRMLMGLNAWQLRRSAYASSTTATNQFAAAAALGMNIEQLGAQLQVGARVDAARYQSATAKSQIIGANVGFFTGMDGVDQEDPTNLKLAWVNCQNGQRFAVYVRQISVKRWEIVVEHYELLFCASTLGVIICPVTTS
jgi:hypothetical protein